MKLGLGLALCLTLTLGLHQAQTNEVQILMFGEIRKIDLKGGVITIRERVFPERGVRRGPPPPPRLGADFPVPARGPRRGPPQVETKVSYSAETIIKASEKTLAANELKVGDAVRITGMPKDKTVIATEIERVRQKSEK